MNCSAPLAEVVELESLIARFPIDGVLAMQGSARRYFGRSAIAAYLASPEAGALDRLALVATRANREPAIAVYRFDEREHIFSAYAIFVLVACGYPADVVGFADATLFRYFELPPTIA